MNPISHASREKSRTALTCGRRHQNEKASREYTTSFCASLQVHGGRHSIKPTMSRAKRTRTLPFERNTIQAIRPPLILGYLGRLKSPGTVELQSQHVMLACPIPCHMTHIVLI